MGRALAQAHGTFAESILSSTILRVPAFGLRRVDIALQSAISIAAYACAKLTTSVLTTVYIFAKLFGLKESRTVIAFFPHPNIFLAQGKESLYIVIVSEELWNIPRRFQPGSENETD